MTIKSITKREDWQNKRVLLRLDLNVPLDAGRILDDERLRAALETIEYLTARGARLIIVSHLGEPSGYDESLSLKPIARRLRALAKKPLRFLAGPIDERAAVAAAELEAGGILLLDNLRFCAGEYENDRSFAQQLAALADVYVNDAFSASHRRQASLAAIKEFLPAYAGCRLEKELTALEHVLRPKKPFILLLGGAKLSTKAPLITKLYSRADRILVGGGLANSLFRAAGWEIGQSYIEKPGDPYARKSYAAALKNLRPRGAWREKLLLPVDVVVEGRGGRVRVTAPDKVRKSEKIKDIGPATIARFAAEIKRSSTLAWNGPVGLFEDRRFRAGTLSMATLIASRSSGRAYGVVGGGETVAALQLTGMATYVDWVSTAGGALLAYLAGEALPGLAKIVGAREAGRKTNRVK